VNKAQLIEALSERLGDRKTASTAVDGLVDVIVRTVNGGEKVNITGFGVFEKRVIDPSLMSGPATEDDWRNRQADLAATFKFTDQQPFWPNNGGNDDNYALTNMYLQEKRLYLQDRVNEYGPLPYACPIVKQLQFIVDRSTFGQPEVTAMLAGANPAVVQAATGSHIIDQLTQ